MGYAGESLDETMDIGFGLRNHRNRQYAQDPCGSIHAGIQAETWRLRLDIEREFIVHWAQRDAPPR